MYSNIDSISAKLVVDGPSKKVETLRLVEDLTVYTSTADDDRLYNWIHHYRVRSLPDRCQK